MTSKGQSRKRQEAGTASDHATVLSPAKGKGDGFRAGFERWSIHTGKLMAVVIDIANGPWPAPDPPHSHTHEQITYVAEGEILFICQGLDPTRLAAGDLYAIPPGIPHAIQLLSPTARLVDCFTPLRQDILNGE